MPIRAYSPTPSDVLAALSDHPRSTAGNLASYMGCEPGPLGAILARLYNDGHVLREGGRKGRWSCAAQPGDFAFFDSVMRSNRSLI